MNSQYQRRPDEDQLTKIILETIDSVIDNGAYSSSRTGEWSKGISEKTIRKLEGFLGYKFIADTLITQKGFSGVHTAHTSFWDEANDGCTTVRWENNRVVCIVKLFFLSIT
eukprot:CFRG1108T1